MSRDKENTVVLVDDQEAIDNSLNIELSDLYTTQSKYTPEEKVEAVMAYVLTGKASYASKFLKKYGGPIIPERTIRNWRQNALWWEDVYIECKKQKQEELDGSFTRAIHNMIEAVEDRISKGDKIYDRKTGDFVTVPMSGKDIAIVLSIIFEKRQLLRGDPTSRVEKTTEANRLDNLEKNFKKFANMHKEWNAKEVPEGDFEKVED